MPDQTETAPGWMPDWAKAEIASLNAAIYAQRERDAIYAEFEGNARSMAYAIWKMRQEQRHD